MTVLRHALCGDDFHQAPVSIILAKNVPSFFFSGFVGDATQVRSSGTRKTFFSGVLFDPKSLFCFTLVAYNFRISAAHRR